MEILNPNPNRNAHAQGKRRERRRIMETSIIDEDIATAHGITRLFKKLLYILLLTDVAHVHMQPSAAPKSLITNHFLHMF